MGLLVIGYRCVYYVLVSNNVIAVIKFTVFVPLLTPFTSLLLSDARFFRASRALSIRYGTKCTITFTYELFVIKTRP